MPSLILFAYLQALDAMTTVIGLQLAGVTEANPLMLANLGANGIAGVLYIKALAVVMSVVVWNYGFRRCVTAANVWFAGLVVWNLVVIGVALV